MLMFISGSFPFSFTVIGFLAGTFVGYFFFSNRTKKLKRRVLELEEDLLKHDARQLAREAKQSRQVLRESPPLK